MSPLPYLLPLVLCTYLLSFSTLVLGSQKTFEVPSHKSAAFSEQPYELKWPVRKVAIIGGGPSGMIGYREFIQAGFNVRVFERDDVPGGNWHYTEEAPVDAPVPNAKVEVGDYAPSLPPLGVVLPYEEEYHNEGSNSTLSYQRREHRGPKPVWESMHSNAPAPWQEIPELPWPVGTAWDLPHAKLSKYMRAFASFHGINSNDGNPNISYDTRVELVEKRFNTEGVEEGWTLTLKKWAQTGKDSSKATWWKEDFDAVVVATGRFNAPNIPPIPGLAEWAKRFPDRISHSRQYRRPQPYTNETILIVGAATSGGEISRDINPHARKMYQSIRPDNSTVAHFPLSNFLQRLPANTTVVPEIKLFRPLNPNSGINESQIELVNGTVLTGIDRIIFATGFRYTFPFLPQYHNSSIGQNETAPDGVPQPLITDGTHIRSLHLDLFYIEEPTIGFLNMNLGMQSFIYAEYLSLALAKVWDNKAKLPNTATMWQLYEERVKDRGGYGKHLQFLGSARNEENIRFFVAWLNEAAVKYGGRQIDGIPKGGEEIIILWATTRFGSGVYLGANFTLTAAGVNLDTYTDDRFMSNKEKIEKIYDAIFNDYW